MASKARWLLMGSALALVCFHSFASGAETARKAISEVAKLFYADLRTEQREQARLSLTQKPRR